MTSVATQASITARASGAANAARSTIERGIETVVAAIAAMAAGTSDASGAADASSAAGARTVVAHRTTVQLQVTRV
jgi:hypothetical protein